MSNVNVETNILTGEKENVISRMPVGNVYGYPIMIRVDLLLKIDEDYGLVSNGSENDFNVFQFDAVQHFIYMMELDEAEEQGLPQPEMRETTEQVKEGMAKYTSGVMEINNNFLNDAIEDYLYFLEWLEEQKYQEASF